MWSKWIQGWNQTTNGTIHITFGTTWICIKFETTWNQTAWIHIKFGIKLQRLVETHKAIKCEFIQFYANRCGFIKKYMQFYIVLDYKESKNRKNSLNRMDSHWNCIKSWICINFGTAWNYTTRIPMHLESNYIDSNSHKIWNHIEKNCIKIGIVLACVELQF